MSALSDIQNRIDESGLKAWGLEATAAVIKTVEAFVCIAWAGACFLALAGFYFATFPIGVLVDIALGAVSESIPPILAAVSSIAFMPFYILNEIIFPEVKKEQSLGAKMKSFKDEVQKSLSETSEISPTSGDDALDFKKTF